MDVAIGRRTSRASGLRNIRDVDENNAGLAGVVPGLSTNGIDKVTSRIGDYVVSSARRETTIIASKVLLIAKRDRLGGVNSEKLFTTLGRSHQTHSISAMNSPSSYRRFGCRDLEPRFQ